MRTRLMYHAACKVEFQPFTVVLTVDVLQLFINSLNFILLCFCQVTSNQVWATNMTPPKRSYLVAHRLRVATRPSCNLSDFMFFPETLSCSPRFSLFLISFRVSAATAFLISCGRRSLIFLILSFPVLLASLSRNSHTESLIVRDWPRLGFLPKYQVFSIIGGLKCGRL